MDLPIRLDTWQFLARKMHSVVLGGRSFVAIHSRLIRHKRVPGEESGELGPPMRTGNGQSPLG